MTEEEKSRERLLAEPEGYDVVVIDGGEATLDDRGTARGSTRTTTGTRRWRRRSSRRR